MYTVGYTNIERFIYKVNNRIYRRKQRNLLETNKMNQTKKYFLVESCVMHKAKKLSTVQKQVTNWLSTWEGDRQFYIVKANDGWDAMRTIKFQSNYDEGHKNTWGEIIQESGKSQLPLEMRNIFLPPDKNITFYGEA